MAKKKLWQVNLQVIEQSYAGGLSILLGIASDYMEAGQKATEKEMQGTKPQSITIVSVKYLGELSF